MSKLHLNGRKRRARRIKAAPLRQKEGLSLEALEPRVLLDVAGVWDELGFRSGSPGGATADIGGFVGEPQLVSSSDGDPVMIWIEGPQGNFQEFIEQPVTFDFRMQGEIYARQFGGQELGWWDLSSGSGDTVSIGTGSQVAAAAGPNGEIFVVWVNGTGAESEIYGALWNGFNWIEVAGSQTDGGISDDEVLNERPDVVVSDAGEVYVSYTALHPLSLQREIVVKTLTFDFEGNRATGPGTDEDLAWVELVDENVGDFGENLTSGITNDQANSFDAAIDLDLDNRPIVVWTHQESADQMEIYLKNWNGQAWVELPDSGVSGSASDTDGDGLSGVSADAAISIQPDVHVTDDGTVIVAWVGWNNWVNYDTDGEAGIYVKTIVSGQWQAYAVGSDTGQGIAADLGWFFNPQISSDSEGRPLITWQGYGENERNTANRDNDASTGPGGLEEPLMAVYTSYFDEDADSFTILSDNSRNVSNPEVFDTGGLAIGIEYQLAFMPTAMVVRNSDDPNDDALVIAYAVREDEGDPNVDDSDIFVQRWDADTSRWVSFGRGSNNWGNDVINDRDSLEELVTPFGLTYEQFSFTQVALIDFDNNPATELDVVLAKPNYDFSTSQDNNGSLFAYNRTTGQWTEDLELNDLDDGDGNPLTSLRLGRVFDLKGDPDVEFNIEGDPLLAVLDDSDHLPRVYNWSGQNWDLIGGGVASDTPGRDIPQGDFGISVQAGPNGQVLLTYVADSVTDSSTRVITRLWDGTAWRDAGENGELVKAAPREVGYYADFNGSDFGIEDDTGATDLEEPDLDPFGFPVDDDGRIEPLPGQWFARDMTFQPLFTFAFNSNNLGVFPDPDDQADKVEIEAGLTAERDSSPAGAINLGNTNRFGINHPGAAADMGLGIVLQDFDTGELGAGQTIDLAAQVDYGFELAATSDLIIEFMYFIDTSALDAADGPVGLQLLVDDIVVDFDGDPLTENDFIVAGQFDNTYSYTGGVISEPANTTAKTPADYRTVRLDTSVLSITNGTTLEPLIDHLEQGTHYVSLRAVALATEAAGGAANSEAAVVAIDNFAVYPRIVQGTVETFQDVPDPALFVANEDLTLTIDHDVDGGTSGADDGGIVARFFGGSGTAQGSYDRVQFNTTVDTPVTLDLSYRLQTTDLVGNTDELALEVWLIDTTGTLPDAQLSAVNDPLLEIVGTDQDTGWRTLHVSLEEDPGSPDGLLAAGSYSIEIRVSMGNTGSAGGSELAGQVNLDNLVLVYDDQAASGSRAQWAIDDNLDAPLLAPVDPGRDAGGARNTGPLDGDGEGVYDFNGNLHSFSTSVISPIVLTTQVETTNRGDIVLGFRYQTESFPDVRLFLNGVEIEHDIEVDDPWWEDEVNVTEYAWDRITIPDVNPGLHQIEFRTAGGSFWMDNFSVITPTKLPVSNINPQAILLPADSSGDRQFGIAVSSNSPGVFAYAKGDEDSEGAANPFPDSPVFHTRLNDGVATSSVFGLAVDVEAPEGVWNRFVGDISDNTAIDFMGLNQPESFNRGSLGDAGITGNFTLGMPSNEIHFLTSITIGPNGLPWVSLQYADTTWVDRNNDQENDGFWGDPFNPTANFLPVRTDYGVEVWRWRAASDPGDLVGSGWEVMFDSKDNTAAPGPQNDVPAYSNPILVGNSGQLPTLSFDLRLEGGGLIQTNVTRLEPDGQWGLLGTNDFQNDEGWDGLIVSDLAVRTDGFPVASFMVGSVLVDGLREFRIESEIPSILIEETSGTAGDNRLEFEPTIRDIVTEPFFITNDGVADLIIYDVSIGGIGSLSNSPFTLGQSTPSFPFTLEPGESRSLNVLFDPEGLEDGAYDALVLVHHSAPNHPSHEFGHFYEVILDAEVSSEADVAIIDPVTEWIEFPDTILNDKSTTRTITITNDGSMDSRLLVSQWFIDGVNFEIENVFKIRAEDNVRVDLDIENTPFGDDDVELAEGDRLTFTVKFTPQSLDVFNEAFYIITDDFDESSINVLLTGVALSGAAIDVSFDGQSLADGDSLDIGSVVTGGSRDLAFIVTNTGPTPLTILDLVSNNPFVTFDFVADIVLDPNESLDVTFTYAPILPPDDPDNPIDPVPLSPIPGFPDLLTTIQIVSDDADISEQVFDIVLFGMGVPERGIVSVTEVGGDEEIQSIVFPATNLNTPVTRTFAISNIGGAPLDISNMLFLDIAEDNPNNPYSITPDIDSGSGTTLLVGESLNFTVTFAPMVTSDLANNNRLRIVTDDRKEPVLDIALFGAAVDPLLSVSDTDRSTPDGQIDFGPVGLGQTSVTQTVTLRNAGNASLIISEWTLTQPSDYFSITPFTGQPIVLAPNGTVDIDVTFRPTAQVTDYQGSISVVNADDNVTTVISLGGDGVQPGELQLSTTTLDFDRVDGTSLAVGVDSESRQVTITNVGDSNLLIQSALFINEQLAQPDDEIVLDPNVIPFSFAPNAAGQILTAGGGSLTLTLTFDPEVSYDDQIFLRIASTDVLGSSEVLYDYVSLDAQAVVVQSVGGDGPSSQKLAVGGGNEITSRLTGGGEAFFVMVQGGEGISRIELIGTTDRSSLTITSRNDVALGQLTGQALKNLTLRNVTLDGDLIDGDGYSLQIDEIHGTVRLGDIEDGADVLLGSGDPNRGIRVIHGDVEAGQNTRIHVDGDVKNITTPTQSDLDVDYWIGGDLGNLAAARTAFSGSLVADNITRAVFGDVSDATISVSQLLKNLTVRGDLTNSAVLGGFNVGRDGALGDSGGEGAEDTLFANGRLEAVNVSRRIENSFVVAGVASTDGDFFNPSQSAIGSVGRVRFGSVSSTQDGTPFGVGATGTIDRVAAGGQIFRPGDSLNEFQVNLL